MGQKILIAYASWAGATREVAEEVAKVFREEGLEVDVKPAKSVRNLSDYQAVVLGSAVRIGNVNSEAVQFLKKQHLALQQKPFAAFLVCLTMKDATEENCALAQGYLDTALKDTGLKPMASGFFAGALILEKLKFPWNFFMSRADFEKGDFRDWDKIRAWAKNTAILLK